MFLSCLSVGLYTDKLILGNSQCTALGPKMHKKMIMKGKLSQFEMNYSLDSYWPSSEFFLLISYWLIFFVHVQL